MQIAEWQDFNFALQKWLKLKIKIGWKFTAMREASGPAWLVGRGKRARTCVSSKLLGSELCEDHQDYFVVIQLDL